MDGGLLLAYVGLGTMAVFPIVIGSMASLHESKNTSGNSAAERMSSSDAYMFPLIGSVTLFGFYLLFKYFQPNYINLLLTAYFSIFGVYAVSSVLEQVIGMFATPATMHAGQFWVKIGGTEEKPRWQFELTAIRVASWMVSIVLTVYYVATKHWIASNILGISFATSAISLIHLDSFKTGAILLSGFFIYDIFWVFGTSVMVKVAKSFDVPAKLLFPKNALKAFLHPSPHDFCLLGLGDIVIPGVFVALGHRFDHHAGARFSFFTTTLLFYILGLATTMAVMHIFKAAQPALLYLSPACILGVVLCGFLNGNLVQVFKYEAEEGHSESVQKKGQSPAKKTSPARPTRRSASPIIQLNSTPTKSPIRSRRTKFE